MISDAELRTACDRGVAAVSPGAQLRAVVRMPTGYSNTTACVELTRSGEPQDRIVVRLYTAPGGDPRRKAEVECCALDLLSDSGVPVAHALLCDPGGDRLGRPGLVTTLLPGQPLLVPTGPVWARALAATLARIHAVPVPDGQRDGLLDADAEARWFLRDPAPPPQLANHELGEAIWRTLRANPSLPADEATLVHLDYWRGNVLWTGGAVTGVVDWEEAACGQPAIDVAYCFADLVIAGFADEAARFLAEYRRLTERALPALPQWELAAAARWLPDPGADEPSPADSERARVNFAGFVESALARCGASASAAS